VVYVFTDSITRLVPYAYLIRAELLVATPKIAQAVIAAASDYYTWQLAVRLFGPDSASSLFAVCYFYLVPSCPAPRFRTALSGC
jgi:GPI mannosyltransferase 3